MTDLLPHPDQYQPPRMTPPVRRPLGLLGGVIGLLVFLKNLLQGVVVILLLIAAVIAVSVLVYFSWRSGGELIHQIDRWFRR